MIEWIKDHEHFGKTQEKHKEFLILVFYANFSVPAKRALAELEQFSKENKQMPVYIIDVERIKGIHKQFGVENVPTVLALRKGKVAQRVEGTEVKFDEEEYILLIEDDLLAKYEAVDKIPE